MMKSSASFRFPGTRMAVDGNTAVSLCEQEASDAAGAYPITPSTQMGEYWADAAAKGHLNISDRPLIFIEPEGEHAAAAVTAGLSMTGLRAANFSSGQGIAYMHESLYAAVGKRLTYVLNIGARAMTKATLNVHAGHDDYHCIDDTGFFLEQFPHHLALGQVVDNAQVRHLHENPRRLGRQPGHAVGKAVG